jgi:hypothetical protein
MRFYKWAYQRLFNGVNTSIYQDMEKNMKYAFNS